MEYSELLDSNASETEIRRHLADGDQVAITVRIPKNLKIAAVEVAELKGMSFSAYIRSCLIADLSSEGK